MQEELWRRRGASSSPHMLLMHVCACGACSCCFAETCIMASHSSKGVCLSEQHVTWVMGNTLTCT
jgi:hypothetical protein